MQRKFYSPITARCLALFLFFTAVISSVNAQQFLTKIDGWNAYVHLPAEYNDSVTKTYPVIIFIPGIGEVGTDPAKLIQNGPGYFLASGANMEFMVNGKLEKPIVISIQPIDAWAPNPYTINTKIDSIVARWRCDPRRINGTGLSMGGQTWQNYVNTGNSILTNRLASILSMSAPAPDNGVSNMKNFVLAGGKWWGFEGTNDYRGMDQIRDVMNANIPGSARYYKYTGGHCCWNTWYNPTWNENGENIYTWMLKQIRPAGANSAPQVDAGDDMQLGTTLPTITLTGIANDPDGNEINFNWRKISGPASGTIVSPNAIQTNITGLITGIYEFEFAVTDVLGAVSRDTITVNDGAVVLPVTLTGFTATEKNGQVLLQWTTSTENNSSHFEIEKMTGSNAFAKTAAITARGGSQENRYLFTDTDPVAGINYYRLKIIDKDGSFVYSDIATVNVKRNSKSALNIISVLAKDNLIALQVDGTEMKSAQLIIADVQGRVMHSSIVNINKGINQISRPVNLGKSVYYVNITAGVEKISKAVLVE